MSCCGESKTYEVRSMIEADLMELSGVVGIGHRNPEIVVYVESKDYIGAVPRIIAGVPVKVVVVGKIMFVPYYVTNVKIDRKAKIRPLIGGISVGNELVKSAGTISIVTYDGYILSNTHVLAFRDIEGNFAPIGTRVVQPGLYDFSTKEFVGKLYKYVKIKYNDTGANNLADCAIATCEVDAEKGFVLCKGNTLCKINGTTEVSIGDIVYKSGRTSGTTEHEVIDTNATVKVYASLSNDRWAVFRDCIILQPEVKAGDSGSLVYVDDKAVGLVFAGSSKIGVACKIKHVINALGINLGEEKGSVPTSKPSASTVEFVKMVLPIAVVSGALLGGGTNG